MQQRHQAVTPIQIGIVAAFCVGLLAGTASCGGPAEEAAQLNQEQATVTAKTIEEAQQHLTDSVMSLAGVTGIMIGECDGAPCIKVLVVRKTDERAKQVPSEFEGYPVELSETGELRPLGN